MNPASLKVSYNLYHDKLLKRKPSYHKGYITPILQCNFNKDKERIEPTFYVMLIKNQIILKTKKLSTALKVTPVYE